MIDGSHGAGMVADVSDLGVRALGALERTNILVKFNHSSLITDRFCDRVCLNELTEGLKRLVVTAPGICTL